MQTDTRGNRRAGRALISWELNDNQRRGQEKEKMSEMLVSDRTRETASLKVILLTRLRSGLEADGKYGEEIGDGRWLARRSAARTLVLDGACSLRPSSWAAVSLPVSGSPSSLQLGLPSTSRARLGSTSTGPPISPQAGKSCGVVDGVQAVLGSLANDLVLYPTVRRGSE